MGWPSTEVTPSPSVGLRGSPREEVWAEPLWSRLDSRGLPERPIANDNTPNPITAATDANGGGSEKVAITEMLRDGDRSSSSVQCDADGFAIGAPMRLPHSVQEPS